MSRRLRWVFIALLWFFCRLLLQLFLRPDTEEKTMTSITFLSVFFSLLFFLFQRSRWTTWEFVAAFAPVQLALFVPFVRHLARSDTDKHTRHPSDLLSREIFSLAHNPRRCKWRLTRSDCYQTHTHTRTSALSLLRPPFPQPFFGRKTRTCDRPQVQRQHSEIFKFEIKGIRSLRCAYLKLSMYLNLSMHAKYELHFE